MKKRTVIITVFIIGVGAMLFLASVFGLFEGTRPDNLGIQNSRLLKCPDKLNCVVSNPSTRHSFERNIAPLPFYLNSNESIRKIRNVLLKMNGVNIIIVKNNYLYAECKTSYLGFVDDLEVYCDENKKQCLVRSASRLGYSDFGVNRNRVEKIRSLLEN